MQRAIRIDDVDDPRIAAYRNIRERDLVGRQARFIAEGRVVLNVILTGARYDLESALVLENRLPGTADLLARLPPDVPLYTASRAILDRIAGFPVHRGILAIGKRRPAETPVELLAKLPANALVLVLCGISNHDNVGSIFRNAAAFEADAILLDETCCDPLYRKAIRVSVGAALKVPFVRGGTIGEIMAALKEYRFDLVALSPGGGTRLDQIGRSDRHAIMVGAEGNGLPADILNSTPTVRIAMTGRFDSLNVAAASAIALHHFFLKGQDSSRASDRGGSLP